MALVTGGSRGIGRATSLLFAWHGAKVVIGDVDSAGEEIAETIKQDDGEAIFVQSDVRTESDVKDLIATVVKTFAAGQTFVIDGGYTARQGNSSLTGANGYKRGLSGKGHPIFSPGSLVKKAARREDCLPRRSRTGARGEGSYYASSADSRT